MRLLLALAAAAGAAYWYYRNRRSPGSQTNASDAMDDIKLGPNASSEEHLDAGVMGTFPASDPVSSKPSETAWEREQRLKKSRV
jgi:hypothetical protein